MIEKYTVKAYCAKENRWVHGYLITVDVDKDSDEQEYYVCGRIDYMHSIDDVGWFTNNVDPNTICRCMYKKDRFGSYLYEGDIVRDQYDGVYLLCYVQSDCYNGWRLDSIMNIVTHTVDTQTSFLPHTLHKIGDRFDPVMIEHYPILEEVWNGTIF